MSLDFHIPQMHKSIQYHLHYLHTIPIHIAIVIASSYILPHIDYCNSLLFNLPSNKLQKLLNTMIRCIFLIYPEFPQIPHPPFVKKNFIWYQSYIAFKTRSSNSFLLETPHLNNTHLYCTVYTLVHTVHVPIKVTHSLNNCIPYLPHPYIRSQYFTLANPS